MLKPFVRKISTAFMIAALIAFLAIQPVVATSNSFINETNSLGVDPTTQHAFSWSLPVSVTTSWIEYAPEKNFKSFSAKNTVQRHADRNTTDNNGGERRIFKVNLTGLKPQTSYRYRLVASDGSISPTGTFRTASKAPETFTFLSVTDTQETKLQNYATWGKTLSAALRKFPEARFLIHTGDMVENGDNISQWDAFMDYGQDKLINLPIVPTVGNHDASNKNKSNVGAHNFTDLFNTPHVSGTGALAGTAYSFDYGSAHIAVLNTECGYDNLETQAGWLVKDMKASKKTWKIVAMHRGPYGGFHDALDIQRKLVPAFDQTGVDLVLEGHDHNYIRSVPIRNRMIMPPGKGTVYIDSNTAGDQFFDTYSQTWQEIDIQPNKPVYLAVTVAAKTLRVQAYDWDNRPIDSLILNK